MNRNTDRRTLIYLFVVFSIVFSFLAFPAPARGAALNVYVRFRCNTGEGFFTHADDHPTIVVEVSDDLGNPISGASITAEYHTMVGVLDGKTFSGFVESPPGSGIYTFDLTANGRFYTDHVADEKVTVTVSAGGLPSVIVEETVRVVDITQKLRVPPPGFTIIDLDPVWVEVDGAPYQAYEMRHFVDGMEMPELMWLVVDQNGDFPSREVYSKAILALYVSERLSDLDAEAMRELATDYRTIITLSSIMEWTERIRNALSTLLGALIATPATGGASWASVADIALHEFSLAFVDAVRESYDPTKPETISAVMRAAYQVRVAHDANALDAAADMDDAHSGPWSHADAEQYYYNVITGYISGRADVESLAASLPDADVMTQMRDIGEHVLLGTGVSKAVLAYQVYETIKTGQGVWGAYEDVTVMWESSQVADEDRERYFGIVDRMQGEYTDALLAGYGTASPFGPTVVLSTPPRRKPMNTPLTIGAYVTSINAINFVSCSIDGGAPQAMSYDGGTGLYELDWSPAAGTSHIIAIQATDDHGRAAEHVVNNIVIVSTPYAAHNYAVTSLGASNTSPEPGQLVGFSGVVENTGSETEANVPVKFLINGDVKASWSVSLEPGESRELAYNWSASSGVWTFELRAELPTDGSPGDDSKTMIMGVGTEGVLLVDGSSSPPTRELSLIQGTAGSYSVTLQNDGDSALAISVSESGDITPYLSFYPTSMALDKRDSLQFDFSISSSAPAGTLTGALTFHYGIGSVVLPLRLVVVTAANGEQNIPLGSSGTVDGTKIPQIGEAYPQWEYHSNISVTVDNPRYQDSFSLTQDEYDRIDEFYWAFELDKITAPIGVRLYQKYNDTWSHYDTEDRSDTWYIVTDDVRPGTNDYQFNIDYYSPTDDILWKVVKTRFLGVMSTAAWSTDMPVDSSTLQTWKDGWDTAYISARVTGVTDGGTVYLINNGKNCDLELIGSSDVGDEVQWELSASELDVNNHFVLLGSIDSEPNVSFSDIEFHVKYFSGDPSVRATKSTSSSQATVGQSVSVNLEFYNAGSNIANEPVYYDSLPSGLQLVSGLLSAEISDIDPGQTGTASYVIQGVTPGLYTLPAVRLDYENPPRTETYSASSNTPVLEVRGGTLQPSVSATPALVYQGSPVIISAVVYDSVTSNPVNDALVIATITDPYGGQREVLLSYDSGQGKYTGDYPWAYSVGAYPVVVSATKEFYTPGTGNTVFDVISAYDVSISPSSATEVTREAEMQSFSLVVENTGYLQDTFALSLDNVPDNWGVGLSPGMVALDPGASSTVSVAVYPPLGASDGDYSFEVIAASWGDSSKSDSSALTVQLDSTPPLADLIPTTNAADYANGETIFVAVDLNEAAVLTADFSSIDSEFDPADVTISLVDAVSHLYQISYALSAENTRGDKLYSILITAKDGQQNVNTMSAQTRLDNHLPSVVGRNPLPDAVVPVDQHITVTFSEEMDQISTESAFSIEPTVGCIHGWSGNTLIVLPAEDLNPGTEYTVSISSAATDLAAKPLAPISWSFWTLAQFAEITHEPVVTATESADVPLSATVTGSDTPVTVALHYRVTGAPSYTETPMSNSSGDIYEGIIPAGAVTSQGVDYYLSATNGAGTTTDGTALEPHHIEVTPRWTTEEMPLQSGWNLISLPLSPTVTLHAENLCTEINAQGGNAVEVNRWHNAGWDPHPCNGGFNDFEIEVGNAYFVLVTSSSAWTVSGTPAVLPITYSLATGWNPISVPEGVSYTAAQLAAAINVQGGQCVEVDRWYAGGWDPHNVSPPINDFLLEPGKGYMIKCLQPSTFVLDGS